MAPGLSSPHSRNLDSGTSCLAHVFTSKKAVESPWTLHMESQWSLHMAMGVWLVAGFGGIGICWYMLVCRRIMIMCSPRHSPVSDGCQMGVRQCQMGVRCGLNLLTSPFANIPPVSSGSGLANLHMCTCGCVVRTTGGSVRAGEPALEPYRCGEGAFDPEDDFPRAPLPQ